ncbi:negative regulation of trophoblast cell migration [Mactra antiquata]
MMIKLLIFLTLLGTTWACTCQIMTDGMRFCRADFVMKIKIKKGFSTPGDEHYQGFDGFYKIAVVELWRMLDLKLTTPIDMKQLYTGSNSALCGVPSLKEGKTYLIGGDIHKANGRLQINACSSFIQTESGKYKEWLTKPPRCDIDVLEVDEEQPREEMMEEGMMQ